MDDYENDRVRRLRKKAIVLITDTDAAARAIIKLATCQHTNIETHPTECFGGGTVQGYRCADCKRPAPYFWCRGNPTVADCIRHGYCRRDPCCGD